MQEGRASTTAALVALCRSIATDDAELGRVCQDPFARRMLPGWLRPVADRVPSGVSRALSLGLVDHLALRTALIDGAVIAAFDQGVRQLVLLGAGLDARAHRLPLPEGGLVYEVDHPATQAMKRAKIERHGIDDSAVRYAACDFHDVTLTEALAGAGHDPSQPSVWVWEGVTMYLEPPAVFASMQTLNELSAEGSRAAVTYVTPQITVSGGKLGMQGVAALGLLSEPVLSMLEPAEFAGRWEEVGWTRVSDDVPGLTAERFGCSLPRGTMVVPDEHVLIVRKG